MQTCKAAHRSDPLEMEKAMDIIFTIISKICYLNPSFFHRLLQLDTLYFHLMLKITLTNQQIPLTSKIISTNKQKYRPRNKKSILCNKEPILTLVPTLILCITFPSYQSKPQYTRKKCQIAHSLFLYTQTYQDTLESIIN